MARTNYVEAVTSQSGGNLPLFVENWEEGQKITPVTGGSRSSAFADAGAVKLFNLTNVLVFVRTDDGSATDDGTSTPLASGAEDTFLLQSTDRTISLRAASTATGSVYCMPMRGAPRG
ncbi:MAG: hypothetical protein K0R61_1180 [Microvirga sp.]|jgi:hypothetical protein|nr:hypothetical protein [Microvirga sp.]MDF2970730.1 hypothetical protein [Microvirga sp.]